MFKKIILDNFKSFEHIELDLSGTGEKPKNWALIYGENGSGKSNIISSFVFLKKTIDTLKASDEIESFVAGAMGPTGVDEYETYAQLLFDVVSRQTNLQTIAKQYRMMGSETGPRVSFGFQIEGHDGYYEMEFDDQDRLISERLFHTLNERAGLIFEIKRETSADVLRMPKEESSIYLSPSMFKNKNYEKRILQLIDQYWGKHTFLSILNAQSEENNEKFMKDSVTVGVLRVMDFFESFAVFCDGKKLQAKHDSPYERILAGLSKGVISPGSEKQLLIFEEMLNDFFTRAYSDIKKVYYKRETVEGKIRYELFFKKQIYGKIREISIGFESSGTQRLLANFPAFYECACGKTVLIDEMDTGIHDLLMDGVFGEVSKSLKGQFIATTHNTLLMEHASPENVYVIRIDSSGYKDIECFKKIDRTQKNHNNRDRYLSGMFDGIPMIGPIGFSEIVSHARDSLEVCK